MTKNALYEIYASKCFSLAHTMVIHNDLLAKSQNTILERKGFRINHNNPKTWKYYLNLTGAYHDSDKMTIAALHEDGHPFMRIKIAGDNKPITVDFTRELVSGNTGDYSLAAEYGYGSDYYNELVRRYPECEALIQGILNPIDMDIAIEAHDGDILYCGGYYRKRLPGLKELHGFERREDVKLDSEFLIEEWEEGLIFDLQAYVKDYLRNWNIRDFQENHTFFSMVMMAGLFGGLITQIHKFRLANNFTYSAHTYHVREYINAFGYLGEYVDALTREQAQYLYRNMRWLTTNKGKEKVLKALIDNLLTPSGIPLVAYNLGHDTWDMQANGRLNPTIEFKKEYLNLDPLTNDVGVDIATILKKEELEARDNGLYVKDTINVIENNAVLSRFNALKTKVLESDFTEMDRNVFFNLEEFQFYQWIYAVHKGTYRGSIFVTHPVTGGRLQLTPLTALNLLFYAYGKGYLGYELEDSPSMIIRTIPRNRLAGENYPTKESLKENSTSHFVNDKLLNKMMAFPLPDHNFSSTTDFNNKTSLMFDAMEARRAIAAAEEDIFANGELELIASKFYHLYIEIPPLITVPYNTWLNNIGIDVSKLDERALQVLAEDLIIAGIGSSDKAENSTQRMHNAIINIVKFFLSYTVQLVSRFTKTTSRTYGLKTLRLSINREDMVGVAKWDFGVLTFIAAEGHTVNNWFYKLNDILLETGESEVVSSSEFPLIDLTSNKQTISESSTIINMIGFTALEPDATNPDYPFIDINELTFSAVTSDVLDDVMDVNGQTLLLELTPFSTGFINTFGLRELGAEDFNVSITLEE